MHDQMTMKFYDRHPELRVEAAGMSLFRRWTGPLRMLPAFLIIGAAKSGTSSLYQYLTTHPNIAPAKKKEVHFFDLNFGKGLDWYRAHFPSIFYRYYIQTRYNRKMIVGEASPYYIFHPLVPKRVFRTLPDAKIIILLRNPVDRAYSHYHHAVKWGFEESSFKEAIEAESDRLEGEEPKLLADEEYLSFSHRHHSYLSRGIYIGQIEAWASLFTRRNMLIMSSEDFFSDPTKYVNYVLSFLGLPGIRLKEYKIYKRGNYAEMDSTVRKRLIEYFKPHNYKLYKYLSKNLEWDR